MTQILFYSITCILILNFLLDRWLDYLNTTKFSSELPEELKGIYEDKKYKESLRYEKVRLSFSLFTETFGFITILALFISGAFGWLDMEIRSWGINNPIFISLIYFAILGLLAEVFSLPVKYYNCFVIEQKFGFNQSTPRIFFLDQLKGLCVGGIFGGVILYLIVWIYLVAGNLFWLYSLGVISFFSLFMLFFYSSLIVPLFNKQTLLQDGELKEAITAFIAKTGFPLDDIYVIDGSKRSTKANAYFTGLGSKKRIVLYDTLISELETEEIVAVLAHEIGHYKNHHVYSGMFLSLVSTAFMLYVFAIVSAKPVFAEVLGSGFSGFHLSIISFGMLYTPLSQIIDLGMNYLSRKNEYQADRFAGLNYESKHLSSALKKLSVSNLNNLTPHSVYVFFHYSHPTLLQRLKKLSEI